MRKNYSLEQNLGITALNLPTYGPLAVSVRRVLAMTTSKTTATTKITTAADRRRPSRPGEDNIFMESLSNMHGRQKGPSQRAQITIQSSATSSPGQTADKETDEKKRNKGRVFFHALERLRSASPPRDGGEANHLTTGSQRNLIWCGSSDCAADCKSDKGGDTDSSNKKAQEGGSNTLPRGQWIENGIMKTVSVRVNIGDNYDVELWELGARER